MKEDPTTFGDIARLMIGGFLGTLGHTATMYFSPQLGFTHINIAGILGSPLVGTWTPPMLNYWWAGMLFHFLLGMIVFPIAYALISGFLAGNRVIKGVVWSMLLFFVGEMIVLPLFGMGRFFDKLPTATLTYALGHLFYGLLFGLVAGDVSFFRTKAAVVEDARREKAAVS